MSPFRQSGFTLIEMLLVMAIVGLILAVAPPLLSAALPGLQLKGSARELMAALRQVRSRAVVQGSEAVLELDVEEHVARVTGDTHRIRLPKAIDITLVTAHRELDDVQRGRIRFYPDGTSTGGRLILRYGTSGYQVDVDWLTGRIELSAAAPP